MAQPPALGRRIHVIGNAASGKTTLAGKLADALTMPLVDLDALNWLPNWVGLNQTDPERFERRLREATASETWVVAGSYTAFSQRTFWSRLDTVIWLDLPLTQLVWRMLRRSWKRWRTRELLWGTNVEKFWPQLMVWRGERSLLWWVVSQHGRKRRDMLNCMVDPRWASVRFVRLTSSREVAAVVESLARGGGDATECAVPES